jgi:hypothetical protein
VSQGVPRPDVGLPSQRFVLADITGAHGTLRGLKSPGRCQPLRVPVWRRRWLRFLLLMLRLRQHQVEASALLTIRSSVPQHSGCACAPHRYSPSAHSCKSAASLGYCSACVSAPVRNLQIQTMVTATNLTAGVPVAGPRCEADVGGGCHPCVLPGHLREAANRNSRKGRLTGRRGRGRLDKTLSSWKTPRTIWPWPKASLRQ